MRLLVLCPHFAPDTAPTGTVMTRLVEELAAWGHEVHVVTSLPWYREHRVEHEWRGRLVRRDATPFGSVTRVAPFAGPDKRNLLRRAAGFGGFCALAGFAALAAGRLRRCDAVLALSPPLPLGVTAWLVSLVRAKRFVFNVQDVFPDAAVASGAITNSSIIRGASALERFTYRRADAVTVLSDDLAVNVAAKLPPTERDKVVTIPNFCDVSAITPRDRLTAYRSELGLGTGPVVMYAGNVGFSQSLWLLLEAARALPNVTFVVNGAGSARAELERQATGLPNVRFGEFQPESRLAEVLATADVHVVPLKAGLGHVSVPSKTYSILAAGRPVLAAIDAGTEVPRILAASGAGECVAPDDGAVFISALEQMLASPPRLIEMGAAGRRWVEGHLSPAAVAARYEAVLARP